ncbi:hypothetical protein HAX54_002398 [Datura stramonium]|uniref:Uncharacterized protein n=1 Tax=Datura stramonium TaxID=4076 RepID=A0ABS8T5D0_DATST|nr:hypothetical protein [Datura stramonium]
MSDGEEGRGGCTLGGRWRSGARRGWKRGATVVAMMVLMEGMVVLDLVKNEEKKREKGGRRKRRQRRRGDWVLVLWADAERSSGAVDLVGFLRRQREWCRRRFPFLVASEMLVSMEEWRRIGCCSSVVHGGDEKKRLKDEAAGAWLGEEEDCAVVINSSTG